MTEYWLVKDRELLVLAELAVVADRRAIGFACAKTTRYARSARRQTTRTKSDPFRSQH
jgi:hypothetical protein